MPLDEISVPRFEEGHDSEILDSRKTDMCQSKATENTVRNKNVIFLLNNKISDDLVGSEFDSLIIQVNRTGLTDFLIIIFVWLWQAILKGDLTVNLSLSAVTFAGFKHLRCT